MKTRSEIAREIVVKEIIKRRRKAENAEYWCSICYDGKNLGDLIVCYDEECLKAYHPGCVYKNDPSVYSGIWTCEAHSCFICHQDRSYYCVGCPKALCTSCIGKTDFVQIEGPKGLCSVCLRYALLAEEKRNAHIDMHFMDHFRWAWKGINERVDLTMEDLRSAENRMKTGKFYISGSDSDEDDDDIERCTGKVTHPGASSERNEGIKTCPVNAARIELERSAAKDAEGPDNPDNLRKYAEHFQKQTPCASAEAGAAATPEDEDNNDGEASIVVPGATFEPSSGRHGSITNCPVNGDGTEMAEKTDISAAKDTEGNEVVEGNGQPLDEPLEAILRKLPEPDVVMQDEDPKSHLYSVRDSQLIILAKKLNQLP